MSSGHVLAHVEDAPRVESSERPTVSRNRERIGYAIGVLGLIVSGLIIYAFGNKVFRLRKLTAEEKLKPGYERILSFLPEMHFMAYCFWLFAVYSNKRAIMLFTIFYWAFDLLLAALAVFYYFYENIEPKENREIYLIIGIVYWTCSFIVSIIWYVTKPKPEGVSIIEELKTLNG